MDREVKHQPISASRLTRGLNHIVGAVSITPAGPGTTSMQPRNQTRSHRLQHHHSRGFGRGGCSLCRLWWRCFWRVTEALSIAPLRLLAQPSGSLSGQSQEHPHPSSPPEHALGLACPGLGTRSRPRPSREKQYIVQAADGLQLSRPPR